MEPEYNNDMIYTPELPIEFVYVQVGMSIFFLIAAYFFYRTGMFMIQMKSYRKLIDDVNDGKLNDPLMALFFYNLKFFRSLNIKVTEWLGDKWMTLLFQVSGWVLLGGMCMSLIMILAILILPHIF